MPWDIERLRPSELDSLNKALKTIMEARRGE